MKYTTNYQNTFIEVAADCPVNHGEIPPLKGDKKTVANMQFDMIMAHPYVFDSDEVLFHCFATKNEVEKAEWTAARDLYFSKGQACFRASPLTKRYGWGVHCDENGKMALYGCETEAYKAFVQDEQLKKVKAMKSKR